MSGGDFLVCQFIVVFFTFHSPSSLAFFFVCCSCQAFTGYRGESVLTICLFVFFVFCATFCGGSIAEEECRLLADDSMPHTRCSLPFFLLLAFSFFLSSFSENEIMRAEPFCVDDFARFFRRVRLWPVVSD